MPVLMAEPRPMTQDERLLKRLGIHTPEMLAQLSESREKERFSNLMLNLINRKPYLSQFILGMVVHTGRAGLAHTKTAGVWVGSDLSVNIALNPFFMQSIERVDVKRGALPIDPAVFTRLELDNYQISTLETPPAYTQKILTEHGIEPKTDKEWLAVRVDWKELIDVMEHEVLHLLHHHLTYYMDREKWPDAQVLNLAMDVAINQFITDAPDWMVTLKSYAEDPDHPIELPPNDAFEVYYALLAEYYKDAERGEVPKDKQKSAVQGFVAGTLISTSMGAMPIESMRQGDEVLTIDNAGALVSRYVTHVKADRAEIVDTPERLATNIFSLKVASGQGFDRASGRAKVWKEGSGWVGIGEQTYMMTQMGPQPVPPAQIGDPIRTVQSGAWGPQDVAQISTEPRQSNEILYQLAVQPIDGPSSFIANGLVVKGIDLMKPPAPGKGPPPPEDDTPPDDDDDVMSMPPPSRPGAPPPPGEGEPKPGEGKPKPGAPGEGKPGEPKPGEGAPTPPKKPKRIRAPSDDHSTWDKEYVPKRLQREAERRLVDQAFQRMKQKGMYGTAPGHIQRIIEEILAPPKVDWRQEMRNWAGRTIKIGHKRTRKRPSRRWGWQFPGRKVVRGGRVWVAVDNSGSVTPQEARQFGAEMISMLPFAEIILIVWDTEIRQVKHIKKAYELEAAFRDLGGGGGSTGVPKVFAALAHPELLEGPEGELLRKRPTGIVVFTDGDIAWPQPNASAGIPTLWGITRETNVDKVPFGIGLHIDIVDID